jgi:hypothetical protein
VLLRGFAGTYQFLSNIITNRKCDAVISSAQEERNLIISDPRFQLEKRKALCEQGEQGFLDP